MKSIRNSYYVEPDELKVLKKLSETTTLNEAHLASILISAALKAVAEKGGKITLPLEVEIKESRAKQ